jgi:hypothetical protein
VIDYLRPARESFTHGDITVAGERLQKFWLMLDAFEQGGIFIMPHLLRNGALIF